MSPSPAADHVFQVRAVSLTDYVSLARSMELDGSAMLREFGIDPRLLADPEALIPAEAVSALLTESALRSGCESFGLKLATLRSFASLGPLSLLLRHESDLRAVVRRLIAYRRLITDVIDFDLQEEGEEARILVVLAPEVATRQSVELVMGLTCRFLGEAVFGGWRPAEAHFRHPAPADLQVHQRTFHAPLRFDAAFDGFLVSTAALDRENAHSDPGFVAHAKRHVDLLADQLPELSLADQVRASIRRLLPDGAATLPKVAGQLNLHPRTLQRKLAASDLVFADLVETIREGVARNLLAKTDLPVTAVAALVGYASPASFSRWFAAAAGQPPREWRLQARRKDPAAESGARS